jgi:hypothetical protein
LVAGELERRWNEALETVNRIEGEIADIVSARILFDGVSGDFDHGY